MPAKQRVQSQPESVLTIGLDIGYGATKAVMNERIITFPSVAGIARQIKFRAEELVVKYPGDQIVDDVGKWFVGDLALAQTAEGELVRLRGRTANEATIGNAFRLRMAKAAIGKLFAGTRTGDIVHLKIVTGLPVDHMQNKTELIDTLLGQHLIQTDSANFIASISEVMVMPQPYGTIYSQMLTPDGDINLYHNHRRTGVVDIGTYTIDLVLDDNAQYVDVESGSIEAGVFTAHQRIASMLEQEHNQKIPFRIIEETLRTGCFRASGEVIDYHDAVEDALAPLRHSTLAILGEKWQSGTTVDVIHLSGGGASLVETVVTAAYKQAHVVKNSQIANAQGYLYYAHFKNR